jgi:hypothetical protein
MKDRCAINRSFSAEPPIERRSEAIANVAYGSKPEKLNVSRCFLLYL